jgi:hypothetical protein
VAAIIPGMRITVMSRMELESGPVPEPLRGTVLHVHESRITWRTPNGSFGWPLLLHDEGVRWIRGHHAPNSQEVLALQAAFALAGSGT